MCLIAYARDDKSQIPEENLQRGFFRNNDAWGVMYPDGERVLMSKDTNLFKDFKLAWDLVPAKTPVAAHFRFATHGAKTKDMAHPFDVLGDGRIGMMHNGVISGMVDKTVRSDTAVFVEEWIKPQLEISPELLEVDAWRALVAEKIGGGSKLLFMLWDGRTFIINEKAGHIAKPGVWYSNEYSITPTVERRSGVPARMFQGSSGSHYGYGHGGYYGSDMGYGQRWEPEDDPDAPTSNTYLYGYSWSHKRQLYVKKSDGPKPASTSKVGETTAQSSQTAEASTASSGSASNCEVPSGTSTATVARKPQVFEYTDALGVKHQGTLAEIRDRLAEKASKNAATSRDQSCLEVIRDKLAREDAERKLDTAFDPKTGEIQDEDDIPDEREPGEDDGVEDLNALEYFCMSDTEKYGWLQCADTDQLYDLCEDLIRRNV